LAYRVGLHRLEGCGSDRQTDGWMDGWMFNGHRTNEMHIVQYSVHCKNEKKTPI